MGWLGTLSLLACAGGPADDPPQEAPRPAIEQPAVQPVAAAHSSASLSPVDVPTQPVPDPDLTEVLDIIRQQAPDTPSRLQAGGGYLDDPWVPDFLVAERGELVPGRWLLWWTQRRGHWEVWQVDRTAASAQRLYAGGPEGRPPWVAATTNYWPIEAPEAALDAPLWWQRYAAVAAGQWDPAAVSLEALTTAASDPHPAVRRLALRGLTVRRLAAVEAQGANPAQAETVAALRCDADRDVAITATLATLHRLARQDLRPLLVHPDPLVASLAGDEWDNRTAEPDSPLSATSCPPATGLWRLHLWSPALGSGPLQATLLGEAGQEVGTAELRAEEGWFVDVTFEVSDPPTHLRLTQGPHSEEQAVPMARGARMAGLCDVPAGTPASTAGFARISRERALRPACITAAVAALTAMGDPALREGAAGRHTNAEERDLLLTRRLQADPEGSVELAERWLRQVRSTPACADRAATVLAAGVTSPVLLDAVRHCRIKHAPQLLADQLSYTETTGEGFAWLGGLPESLDDDLATRLRTLVQARAATEPVAAYRLLAELEGAHNRRSATYLALLDGGALLGPFQHCEAEPPGRTLVDGVLVLGHTEAEGVRVEHLDPAQAAAVHTVACGARLLWQRPP